MKLLYLTFNNGYSGIYRSQVLDVARHWEEEFGLQVRVLALISLRDFWRERKKLKASYHRMTVLPMVPGVRHWKWNLFFLVPLLYLMRPKALFGRAVFAASLGVALRKWGAVRRVAFDGRAATAAEWKEYRVGDLPPEKVEKVEKKAVLGSDYCLAVSEKLVEYWRERYGYAQDRHVVVPSTLDEEFFRKRKGPSISRESLGFSSEDIIVVYAGTASLWHSFGLMDDFMVRMMERDPRVKWLLLSNVDETALSAHQKFGEERVLRRWVEPSEVPSFLGMADYGLLMREDSVTNKVASPTKFAEYLASGLKLLISPNIGDLSELVEEKGCGQVIPLNMEELPPLKPLDERERENARELARASFRKSAYNEEYRRLLEALKVLE